MAGPAFPSSHLLGGLLVLALLAGQGGARSAYAAEPSAAGSSEGPARAQAVAPDGDGQEALPFRVEPDLGAPVGGEDAGVEPAPNALDQGAPEGESVEAREARELETAKAEEKRRRQERIVAFARRRVREMAARKRAQARAEARAEARAREAAALALANGAPNAAVPSAAFSSGAAKENPGPLPSIVDHRSALERQLVAHWGWGADKDGQVRVPLPDWQNWQRVRLFGIEHVTAFRYTKQHHTLTAVFAVETKAEKPSSLSCMAEFERRGLPELRRYGVHIDPIQESMSRWDERPVLVHETEGKVSFLFSRYEFSVAWTAYPAYDHGCLVYATVVLWDGQPELARRLLDRFVEEGVGRVRPLTASLPGPVAPPAMAPTSSSSQSRVETAQRR